MSPNLLSHTRVVKFTLGSTFLVLDISKFILSYYIYVKVESRSLCGAGQCRSGASLAPVWRWFCDFRSERLVTGLHVGSTEISGK